MEKLKPWLPVLYIAIGAALCWAGMRACQEPSRSIEVRERIDTLRALPDTVERIVTVPRYIERPLPEPTPDSTAAFWIELLWSENTELRKTLADCRGLELEAVTENERYQLRQRFIGSEYWERGDAKAAMPHELILHQSDTTRTEIQSCPTDWWRTLKDYALAGTLIYIVIDIIRHSAGWK